MDPRSLQKIKKMALMSILGFALRGGSSVARFLFVMYLAKTTNPTLLGQVAVFIAVNAVFTQIAGLEINQVIGRQLHSLKTEDRQQALQHQVFATLFAYLLLIPTIISIYPSLLNGYWISACGILVLEHLLTEVYRFNILMLRPTYASSLLFIKNTGWIVCFITIVELKISEPSFALIINSWFIILLIVTAPMMLTHNTWQILKQLLKPSIWLKPTSSLIWQARPFIVSALAMAAIGSMDKLLIGNKFSTPELGVYFFFATCASIITLIVSFSIGATVGPQCIKAYATQGKSSYQQKHRQLKQLYWLMATTTALAIIIPADFLLKLLGKNDYQSHIDILYCLVPSTAFLVLCEPYKINAYLEHRDLSLVLGNLFHALTLFICIYFFAQKGDIFWVSTGVLVSSILVYIFFSSNMADRIICRKKTQATQNQNL